MLVEAYTAGKDAAFDKVAVSMGWIDKMTKKGLKTRYEGNKGNYYKHVGKNIANGSFLKDTLGSGVVKNVVNNKRLELTKNRTRFLDLPKSLRDHTRMVSKKTVSKV